MTKNFLSIDEPFQNLAMRSKGIIKTCPNFISSTTFLKKNQILIFFISPTIREKNIIVKKVAFNK